MGDGTFPQESPSVKQKLNRVSTETVASGGPNVKMAVINVVSSSTLDINPL
jgi:hypothetical protein